MVLSCFKKLAVAAAVLSAMAIPGAALAEVATANVNLRTGPGTHYPVVVVVPAGAPIHVHGCDPGWCHTTYSNWTGWLASQYVGASYRPPVIVTPPPIIVHPPYWHRPHRPHKPGYPHKPWKPGKPGKPHKPGPHKPGPKPWPKP